jgi:hypothetical protein
VQLASVPDTSCRSLLPTSALDHPEQVETSFMQSDPSVIVIEDSFAGDSSLPMEASLEVPAINVSIGSF